MFGALPASASISGKVADVWTVAKAAADAPRTATRESSRNNPRTQVLSRTATRDDDALDRGPDESESVVGKAAFFGAREKVGAVFSASGKLRPVSCEIEI